MWTTSKKNKCEQIKLIKEGQLRREIRIIRKCNYHFDPMFFSMGEVYKNTSQYDRG